MAEKLQRKLSIFIYIPTQRFPERKTPECKEHKQSEKRRLK